MADEKYEQLLLLVQRIKEKVLRNYVSFTTDTYNY